MTHEKEVLKEDVLRLSAEVSNKGSIIRTLEEDKKALQEMNTQQLYFIKRLQKDVEQHQTPLRSSDKDHELQRMKSKNTILTSTIERYESALKGMQEIARLSIQSLTGAAEVSKEEIQTKLRAIMASMAELKSRPVDSQRSDSSLLTSPPRMDFSVTEGDDPVNVKSWLEEKRLLQAEMKKYADACAQHEKTIKAQTQRIILLTNSFDSLTEKLNTHRLRRPSINELAAKELGAQWDRGFVSD
jgi:hypothetical protein